METTTQRTAPATQAEVSSPLETRPPEPQPVGPDCLVPSGIIDEDRVFADLEWGLPE